MSLSRRPIALLPWTAVAAGAQGKTSEIVLNEGFREIRQQTELSMIMLIDFGLEAATASPGTQFRIQISGADSGDDFWRNLYTCQTSAMTPAEITLDGAQAAGTGTTGSPILIGATTPVAGDKVFFKNATLALSEISVVTAISAGTSFVCLDALTNAQGSAGGKIYTGAESFVIPIDVFAARRMRVVCNNNFAASPVAVSWRASYILL